MYNCTMYISPIATYSSLTVCKHNSQLYIHSYIYTVDNFVEVLGISIIHFFVAADAKLIKVCYLIINNFAFMLSSIIRWIFSSNKNYFNLSGNFSMTIIFSYFSSHWSITVHTWLCQLFTLRLLSPALVRVYIKLY